MNIIYYVNDKGFNFKSKDEFKVITEHEIIRDLAGFNSTDVVEVMYKDENGYTRQLKPRFQMYIFDGIKFTVERMFL